MIGQDIFLFKNFLLKDDCDFITNTIESFPAWEEAKTAGNVDGYRKTQVDYLTNRYGQNSKLYKVHSTIGYHFKMAFEYLTEEYKIENKSYLYYTGDEGIQILKYGQNQFYKEHIDSGINLKRVHTCLIYLNDEYEGGETFFPRQQLLFKGEIGDLIFFPSTFTHPHIAKEVKNGNKYMAVMWSY